MKWKKYWKLILVVAVIFFDIFIFYAERREYPNNILTVAFFNVGQGDAIYIESPTHTQILIDGGPSSAILSELGKFMPFYDRSIDVIVVTNPDKDHYAGFIDVLQRFDVGMVVESGTKSDTETYKAFLQAVVEEKTEKIVAKRGMKLDLGGGAELHILYPDRDVSLEKTNEGSLIAKLYYGSTTILFTGDTTDDIEQYLVANSVHELDSDILKIAHHGSKTSTSENFVQAVSPHTAIISAGCNNRYGHPHKETVELLEKEKINILTTCKEGTIVFKLDGKQEVRQ